MYLLCIAFRNTFYLLFILYQPHRHTKAHSFTLRTLCASVWWLTHWYINLPHSSGRLHMTKHRDLFLSNHSRLPKVRKHNDKKCLLLLKLIQSETMRWEHLSSTVCKHLVWTRFTLFPQFLKHNLNCFHWEFSWNLVKVWQKGNKHIVAPSSTDKTWPEKHLRH